MRSLLAVSICVATVAVAACGGSATGSTGSEASSSEVAQADKCLAGPDGVCGPHAIDGAFVADSVGPYAALVLGSDDCTPAGSDNKAFCFFGQLADGARIDGVYTAERGKLILGYYPPRSGEMTHALFHFKNEGGSLQLSAGGDGQIVETMATVKSFCLATDDCRDQDLVPAACTGDTAPVVSCEDKLCATACRPGKGLPVPTHLPPIHAAQ